MKKIKLGSIVLMAVVLLYPTTIKAQINGPSGTTAAQNLNLTVESKALIAIYSSAEEADIEMTLAGASEAGAELTTVSQNTATRMRITSSVQDGNYRKITAQLGASILTTGTELLVTFGAPSGFLPQNTNGGTINGQQNLTSGTAMTVVYGITSCYSGTLATSGYPITYDYRKNAAYSTYINPENVIITYTITDEAAGNNLP